MSDQAYYSVLGLAPGASHKDVKTAYHTIVLQNHPDKTAHRSDVERKIGEELTKDANKAWEVLSDPDRRKYYDAISIPLQPPPWPQYESPKSYKPPSWPDFFSYAEKGRWSYETMNLHPPNSQEAATYRLYYPGHGESPLPTRGSERTPPQGKRDRFEEEDSDSDSPHPKSKFQKTDTSPPRKEPENMDRNPLRWGSLPRRSWTTSSTSSDSIHPQSRPQAPPPPPAIEIHDKNISLRIQWWDISVRVSEKYKVVGGVEDLTQKGTHDTTISIRIVLEQDQDFQDDNDSLFDSDSEEEDDIHITIHGTLSGRDVASVSSLLKYEIRKDDSEHMMFILTLNSPGTGSPLPKSSPWKFSFNLTTSYNIPDTATYTATHQIFSKAIPNARVRDGQRMSSYPPARPEFILQGMQELEPLHLLNLWEEYYTKTGEWHRLAAVGYRANEKDPEA